jgi:hypothetical protein
VSKVQQYNTPSVKTEAELAKELIWLSKDKHEAGLRYNEVYNWALHRLSQKYHTFGDMVKAQCLDIHQDKQFYDDPGKMKALISFMDKPGKSPFEEFLVSIHPYSKDVLFDYQAIDLIYQYKFQDALAKFNECKGSGSDALLGDPFIIHINDCHDCDHQAQTSESYTKYTFVKRLAELEDFSSGDSKKMSETYFLLANGLYNMTYFGNARVVYGTPIKDRSLVYFEYNSDRKALDELIYDCSKAEEYYRKAMELSVDKEFKAKCCFMAAKCEQNAYFISADFSTERAVRSGKYFKQLQESFSKTNYYKEILKECGYFSSYQAQWLLKKR